ncbi:MAG: maltose/glucose-specific PTS transporter subunit IIC [Peptostreptococcus sp.]|uniref:Putative PTS system glucose-specific EIICBA component n=1 Tax=Peptostreptococcus anaerobius TaxID=1261 RepID=A0A135YVY5_9FIRM|nr:MULTISPECIES: PTS transporter subunit IIABC [Peptostreptococcus]KXI13559.1 putative PTS system glucose-specific EIICBA component [Peptostreptococcus anaerobius]MDU3422705.1 maltose/glucose-specific PTS transporter subunit IIC [Peptostreptococcus anaerobius]MDU3429589.1 maltose/glucose-specific PTS transporter subunit IIC [Peptostreptococcus sp.]MDU3454790.1 maltose/glucose-specific PTS transporter subunit IIC [Peptostreptococcus sp.]MDU5095792.1 maltose/glucose-specific PTS transporter subu
MGESKIFGILQRIGRSFMLPIAILPVAGLFLGIGGSFTNPTTIEAYNLTAVLGPGTFANSLLTVMAQAGEVVFANLPILFAMGVAIGMAKAEKAVAALAGALSFFIMHTAIAAMITVNGGADKMLAGSVAMTVGIQSLQMGVFGGIIVGLGVAYLHNKFYKIQLPQALSFFSGTRFVPIITAIVYLVVGILMFYVWPTVQLGINQVGQLVRVSGYFGTWIYGFMERILIPFGLHHVFYLPFWQTSVGGTLEVGGKMIEGAQNIFFAQLADPTVQKFSVDATRFMAGKFPLMIFGLPGAALAMYKTAKPEKRKVVGGLLFSAALTSMLTGITEPIEFTFLFVAPFLYLIHCIFAGLAYMLMHIMKVAVGMTFSGGLIDMTLFGILQGQSKTNWIGIVIAGIGYFVVYYFLFSFLIKKFNLKTPGREDDANAEVKLYTKADVNAKKGKESSKGANASDDELSIAIVHGLGGKSNIESVDNCITRLRCVVVDSKKVKDDVLKATGAAGVIKSGSGVQVIYGPKVSIIKSNLEEYLENSTVEDAYVDGMATKVEEEPKKILDLDSSLEVLAPVNGTIHDLSKVNDEVFSQKLMGEGFAAQTEDGDIYSPVSGEVGMIFPTKHAIIVATDDGLEVLIHMGIDTVKLEGEGFELFCSVGDKVKAGDKLAHMDLEFIKSKGYETITPVIFTNLEAGKTIEVSEGKSVKAEAGRVGIR